MALLGVPLVPPVGSPPVGSPAGGGADGATASAKGDEGLLDGGSVQIAPARFALQLRRCGHAEWQRFHTYHYKTAQLSTVATTFLLEATLGAHDEWPAALRCTMRFERARVAQDGEQLVRECL